MAHVSATLSSLRYFALSSLPPPSLHTKNRPRAQPWRKLWLPTTHTSPSKDIRAIQRGVEPSIRENQPKPAESVSIDGRALTQRSTTISDAYSDENALNQLDAFFRLSYVAGMYGAMALAGQAICYITGVDNWGGFELCAEAAMKGLGYAVPPMMALLFILDDEVVKNSSLARAIRDVEDEELLGFFSGLSPWEFMLVVTMASVAEEIFFRIAIQGGLAHMFLTDQRTIQTTDGIAALTGIFPFFAPFAHVLAAVLTAALTGSIFYVTSPQDPTYVVAPVVRNHAAQRDIKKCFAAWYERRQLRKIYSPLLEALLALYLGVEWIQTGNILAPIITHGIYTTVILGNGLRRIHDQRQKLRQRTQSVSQKRGD